MVEKKYYSETLLSHSKIWLLGRALADIVINKDAYDAPPDSVTGSFEGEAPRLSQNNFLVNQLSLAEDPKFARIFGFTYEGTYFDLQRPALFLVHGDGIDVDTPNLIMDPNLHFLDRSPAGIGRTGLGTQAGAFAADVKAWAYDRADFTIRMDVDTGTFDTLLLSAELGGWDLPSRSAGAVARSGGAVARSAGAVARAAGAVARARRGSDE
jgi:hypothetical protein